MAGTRILPLAASALLTCSCSLMWDLDPDALSGEDGQPDPTPETTPDGEEDTPFDLPTESPVDVPAETPTDITTERDAPPTTGLCTLIEETQITTTGGDMTGFVLDWTGSRFGALWQVDGFHLVEIEPDGSPVGTPADLDSSHLEVSQDCQKLVWTGSEHVGFWTESRGVSLLRFTPAGSLAGATTPVTSTGSYLDALWTGSELAMVWTPGSDSGIELARIDTSGALVDTVTTISPAGTAPVLIPSMTWTGSELGIAWPDERDGNREIYFARVDADGAQLGTESRMTSNLDVSQRVKVTWTGSEYSLVWKDSGDGGSIPAVVRFARTTPTGTIVNTAEEWEGSPCDSWISMALEWSGSEILLAWNQNPSMMLSGFGPLLDRAHTDLRVREYVGDASEFSTSTTCAWTGSSFGYIFRDTKYMQDNLFFITAGPCPE
jgi:hypothetical protein